MTKFKAKSTLGAGSIHKGGELGMIDALRRRARRANPAVRLGIGDDCALLRPGAGEDLAITTDFSLEGVHFRRDWHPPESAGHRCLARGLSDLAAMGARPLAALLSLAVPPELALEGGRSWVDGFLDGFLALADRYNVALIGGDTARSSAGLVLADVVLIGSVKRGRELRRSGARAGDRIFITGALGGAAAELLGLERGPERFRGLTAAGGGHPQLYPEPRVAVGRKLAGLATAAIDLSDGLSSDLRHICDESGLAAEVHGFPLHPLALGAEGAGWTPSALGLGLDGGEDYELLFTAAPDAIVPARLAGVPICPIGEMKPRRRGRATIQMRINGKLEPVAAGGWEHFRRP